MRIDVKVAIAKSGLKQYEIARQSRLSEGKLSRFINERGGLRPEEEARLWRVLGLTTGVEEAD